MDIYWRRKTFRLDLITENILDIALGTEWIIISGIWCICKACDLTEGRGKGSGRWLIDQASALFIFINPSSMHHPCHPWLMASFVRCSWLKSAHIGCFSQMTLIWSLHQGSHEPKVKANIMAAAISRPDHPVWGRQSQSKTFNLQWDKQSISKNTTYSLTWQRNQNGTYNVFF